MNTQLKIKSLRLENFRCFKKIQKSVLFNDDLTVLVARNGEGKTAFLDAVKIALGTFTGSFPVTTQAHFHPSDAHISISFETASLGAEYPISVEATGVVANKEVAWSRYLQKVNGRTTTRDAKPISDYGDSLCNRIQSNDENISLPLIAFYGTGRLWAEHKDMDDGVVSALAMSRFAGYENALSARSNYKQVKNWLLEALMVDDSKQASSTQAGQLVLAQLGAVKRALKCVLDCEGLDRMHYNAFFKNEISVVNTYSGHEDNSDNGASVSIPVSYLSDGVRAVFSMVADIAYRCAKLNPHLGESACEETCGIVLIDEVDIFLHPAWQQHILRDLQKAFPNIQFIVTTHSPQVVSSVPRSCVRIIDNRQVYDASIQTDGARSDQVLKDVFGVDARVSSSQVVKDLIEYQSLINGNEWNSDRGLELRAKLHDALSTDPILAELDMEIHLKEYQRRHYEEN